MIIIIIIIIIIIVIIIAIIIILKQTWKLNICREINLDGDKIQSLCKRKNWGQIAT